MPAYMLKSLTTSVNGFKPSKINSVAEELITESGIKPPINTVKKIISKKNILFLAESFDIKDSF